MATLTVAQVAILAGVTQARVRQCAGSADLPGKLDGRTGEWRLTEKPARAWAAKRTEKMRAALAAAELAAGTR